jgi:hypothetical protein
MLLKTLALLKELMAFLRAFCITKRYYGEVLAKKIWMLEAIGSKLYPPSAELNRLQCQCFQPQFA